MRLKQVHLMDPGAKPSDLKKRKKLQLCKVGPFVKFEIGLTLSRPGRLHVFLHRSCPGHNVR